MEVEVVKKIVLKLTGKEYDLLRQASNLIGRIASAVDFDDFGKDYDLRGVEYTILNFLDDNNVYVVREEN